MIGSRWLQGLAPLRAASGPVMRHSGTMTFRANVLRNQFVTGQKHGDPPPPSLVRFFSSACETVWRCNEAGLAKSVHWLRSYSDLSEAMSIEKRYFTSDFANRS